MKRKMKRRTPYGASFSNSTTELCKKRIPTLIGKQGVFLDNMH